MENHFIESGEAIFFSSQPPSSFQRITSRNQQRITSLWKTVWQSSCWIQQRISSGSPAKQSHRSLISTLHWLICSHVVMLSSAKKLLNSGTLKSLGYTCILSKYLGYNLVYDLIPILCSIPTSFAILTYWSCQPLKIFYLTMARPKQLT